MQHCIFFFISLKFIKNGKIGLYVYITIKKRVSLNYFFSLNFIITAKLAWLYVYNYMYHKMCVIEIYHYQLFIITAKFLFLKFCFDIVHWCDKYAIHMCLNFKIFVYSLTDMSLCKSIQLNKSHFCPMAC